MKEYQVKALERLSMSEHKAALEVLQPAMTTLLDYQIERLTDAIAREPHRRGGNDAFIQSWTNVLAHLKQAREEYHK